MLDTLNLDESFMGYCFNHSSIGWTRQIVWNGFSKYRGGHQPLKILFYVESVWTKIYNHVACY